MNSAIEILGITGPIYLAIALGYIATRRGLFSSADMPVFGKFAVNIALPALLFNALSQRSVGEIFNVQYMSAYAAGSLLMMGLGLWWARKVQRRSLSYSSLMAMGMACPNSGFVGYPIMLLTLGPVAGVALALNMVVENLVLIPILLAVADSDGDKVGHWRHALVNTFKGLLKNPMIWGIVGGLAWSLSGWQLPAALGRTVNLFAAASAALSLFVIGGSLVGLKVQGHKATVWQITLGKLFFHPLAMIAVLMWIFPVADPALRSAALLSAALPMLGIYTILNQRHGHGAVSAAALLVTTVVSFFTLSALLWVLRHNPI
jgi:malonate transporter and related proteins